MLGDYSNTLGVTQGVQGLSLLPACSTREPYLCLLEETHQKLLAADHPGTHSGLHKFGSLFLQASNLHNPAPKLPEMSPWGRAENL